MSKQAYSKAKGNLMENKVFRDLREIMDHCYKSIGSGSGDDNGDILTGCFCIEIKHHKVVTDGKIDKWWVKIAEEADANGREPILIYKENRREPIVMFFDDYRNTNRIMMRYSEWLQYLREGGDGNA